MKLKMAGSGLLVGLVLVSFGTFGKEAVGNGEWRQRMQAMLTDVLALFPYAFDEAKFNDPANTLIVEKSIKSLAQHSSGLKKHTSRLKSSLGLKIDPSFPFIADAFENEITAAQIAFLEGKDSYPQSQIYLRSALSKCVLCHTQSANGPELKLSQFDNQFLALSSPDRFIALAATRQFDSALSEFEKILHDSKVKKSDPFTTDREAKEAIAIAVRVKKDPKIALKLIDEIAEAGSGSTILQNDLKGWRKSVLAWQAEKNLALDSDQALFSEATRLIEAGKSKERSLEIYENSNVTLLRASSYLHDLLSNYPKSPLRAKSYLLLASTYDLLPGFALWDLANEYLGACVQENPHSKIGETCFSEYNDNIVFGYSGSSGTHIPRAVSQHLARMKELATQHTGKKPETHPK